MSRHPSQRSIHHRSRWRCPRETVATQRGHTCKVILYVPGCEAKAHRAGLVHKRPEARGGANGTLCVTNVQRMFLTSGSSPSKCNLSAIRSGANGTLCVTNVQRMFLTS